MKVTVVKGTLDWALWVDKLVGGQGAVRYRSFVVDSQVESTISQVLGSAKIPFKFKFTGIVESEGLFLLFAHNTLLQHSINLSILGKPSALS